MPSSFKINRNAERDIARMARVTRDQKANEVVGKAKDFAPVLTGRYRESLHAESDDDEARVVASVPYAAFVEARDNVLGRALAAERV